MEKLSITKIEKMIYIIRGQKVMIDSDLAELYGVETKALKRTVKRNMNRFPNDFMFEMTKNEFENWRCQLVPPIRLKWVFVFHHMCSQNLELQCSLAS